MAVGQNQWPSLEYFSGHWDVHCGYGLLTHDQMAYSNTPSSNLLRHRHLVGGHLPHVRRLGSCEAANSGEIGPTSPKKGKAVWVNYNDLTRPHPKWWFMWGMGPPTTLFQAGEIL